MEGGGVVAKLCYGKLCGRGNWGKCWLNFKNAFYLKENVATLRKMMLFFFIEVRFGIR